MRHPKKEYFKLITKNTLSNDFKYSKTLKNKQWGYIKWLDNKKSRKVWMGGCSRLWTPSLHYENWYDKQRQNLSQIICNNWVEIIETISATNPPQIGYPSGLNTDKMFVNKILTNREFFYAKIIGKC